VNKKATGKDNALRAKVTRTKHVTPEGKPSKMYPNAIKAIIGLKTVKPNIMKTGDL
jgi:hypothetical protein